MTNTKQNKKSVPGRKPETQERVWELAGINRLYIVLFLQCNQNGGQL